MPKIYLYLIILALLVSSCAKKPLSSLQKPVPENVVLKDAYSMVVSFFSIGYGTNREAKNKFLAYVDKFQKAHSPVITPLEAPWGREGEIDYCIDLERLSTGDRTNFISSTRALLEKESLVRIELNAPCRNFPKDHQKK